MMKDILSVESHVSKPETVKRVIFELGKLIEQKNGSKQLFQLAEIILDEMSLEILLCFKTEELYQYICDLFDFVKNSSIESRQLQIKKVSEYFPGKLKGNSLIFISTCDKPFIVESTAKYFQQKKYRINQLLHPQLSLDYDKNGELESIRRSNEEDLERISFVFSTIENIEYTDYPRVEKEVKEILEMIDYVSDDFSQITSMLGKIGKTVPGRTETLKQSEIRQLFAWFNSGNMILLGGCYVSIDDLNEGLTWDKVQKTSGYVRQRKDSSQDHILKEFETMARHFLDTKLFVNLMETEDISLIRRREKIMMILHKRVEKDGDTKIYFFPALFTDKSRTLPALSIPLVRLKINAILENNNFIVDSYSYKKALTFFNIMPRGELFRLDREELNALLEQTLFALERQQAKVFIYTPPNRRYARVSVIIPSRRFTHNIIEQIGEVVSEMMGKQPKVEYGFPYQGEQYNQFIFWFSENEEIPKINSELLENKIIEATKIWEDSLLDEIHKCDSPETFNIISRKFIYNFGKIYKAVNSPQEALKDIYYLNKLIESQQDQIDVRRINDAQSKICLFSLKKYHLVDIMPRLQHVSMDVIDETTFELKVESAPVYIYNFNVNHKAIEQAGFESFRERFKELFSAIMENNQDDTSLNGLLTVAGLNKDEVNLFILYRNYFWQVDSVYARSTINRTILNNTELVLALKKYFFHKFKPAGTNYYSDEEHLEEIKKDILHLISNVKTVTEDVIFKNIFNLMTATVRTNFFATGPDEALAVKVKSELVANLPLPKPFYEIYAHGAHMEGIHLRGGMTARGGIRHSDRHDDFRTEILGLMKAQMKKNTVIVPVGSKGGFITKRKVTGGHAAMMEEGKTQYKVYINSLLSMSDNIIEGQVVHPENVVRYDGDDPYLVVAADKGTAHLSDTANEISESRNFWLGDAFASGGSVGYDHKKYGVTARGGWECVKLHFLELKQDIQNEDFTVIGIGDMSGDVFGNGMLLSKHIKLIGAFNHVHIFVDPNPDPAASWQERDRLFKMPRSSWMDYDKTLISKGGGIFERNAKAIELSPEIQKMLGVSVTAVSGEELIKLLLKAKADLLWNGGIGTYVKASSETNLYVGDQSNDFVRINADELRVKVVGEGGNLGLTQLARIEYHLNGGKINADAIDNSGGVDTSDHEVNLKIILNELIADGKIQQGKEREDLLFGIADEVCDLCMEDNISQGQIISMDLERSKKDHKLFLNHMQYLEERTDLNRRTEFIPNNKTLTQYVNAGHGIPRPIISVQLSYTKVFLYNEIINSSLPDADYLQNYFIEYFPESFREKYDLSKYNHRLKREIITTRLVNEIINQAGICMLPAILPTSTHGPVEISTAYIIVDHLIKADQLRKGIFKQFSGPDISKAYPLLINLEEKINEMITWILINFSSDEINFSLLEIFEENITRSNQILEESLNKEEQEKFKKKINSLIKKGLSDELAEEIAKTGFLKNILEISLVANSHHCPLPLVISTLNEVNTRFHFDFFHEEIMELEINSNWERKHRGIILKGFYQEKDSIINSILNHSEYSPEKGMRHFVEHHAKKIQAFEKEYLEFKNQGCKEISGHSVILESLKEISR